MDGITKIKEKLNEKRNLLPVVGGMVATVASAVPVFAEGETPSGNVSAGMTTALETGFGNVQTDVMTLVTTALPYALAVMGIGLAIKIGIKIYKTVTAK